MYYHLKVATLLAEYLDTKFKIGKFKFGLDPILGLFPGFGDIISIALSFYIIWIGQSLKLPKDKISQMYRNVLVDSIVGLIPVVGDLADFVIKANTKNLAIIKKYAPAKIVEGEFTSV